MAKRVRQVKESPGLFAQHEQALQRRIRRQRALFIPHYLTDAAKEFDFDIPEVARAHAIAVRWADLETAGHLPKYKETTIDTQFLEQLFAEGLGYKIKTQSPNDFNLEH